MLRLVVALPAEAKPIVSAFGLRPDPSAHPYKIFSGEDATLIVSGPGKVASAAATAYLAAASGGGRQHGWLNVGIAGHRDLGVGSVRLAAKVEDRSNGRSWYPPPVLDLPIPREQVRSVDRVEEAYREPCLYEMEAGGFYPTACRFSTAELVHCLKVVSDGPERPSGCLDAAAVAGLIEGAREPLGAVVEALRDLSSRARRLEADPPDYDRLRSRFHFTVSEQRELRRLLARRRALAPGRPLPAAGFEEGCRGRQVNEALARWLDSLPVALAGRGERS